MDRVVVATGMAAGCVGGGLINLLGGLFGVRGLADRLQPGLTERLLGADLTPAGEADPAGPRWPTA